MINSEAFMDVFIQKVVEEVIKRIKNRPKTALVVFSGAAIGFKQAMDSLVKLKNDGWQLKVFLSDEAMHVFTPSYIQETLGLDTIYNSDSKVAQKELYGEVDQILLQRQLLIPQQKLLTVFVIMKCSPSSTTESWPEHQLFVRSTAPVRMTASELSWEWENPRKATVSY